MKRNKLGRYDRMISDEDLKWLDNELRTVNEPMVKTAEKLMLRTKVSYFYAYQVVMKQYRQIKTKELTN